jgi:hypothetical protein
MGKGLADAVGEKIDSHHFCQSLGKFIRHRLTFCHAYQPACSTLSYRTFPPHIENHLVRANPQTEQVIVVSVQPNVVELESAVRAKRSRFHFESYIPDSEVCGRNSPSIANCYAIQTQEAPYEFLPDLATISISEHSVSHQRRVAPDVFRRVFTDDGHQ